MLYAAAALLIVSAFLFTLLTIVCGMVSEEHDSSLAVWGGLCFGLLVFTDGWLLGKLL